MRVKWRKWINIPETYWEMFGDNPDVKDYRDYEGEVIGTNAYVFSSSTVVVACTDNKIREISIDEVEIINQ